MSDSPADDGETALLSWASALTKDAAEAQALVAQTLRTAGADIRRDHAAADNQVQLFRSLRQSYHSVERTRSRRPVRDAVITAMAVQPRPTTPLD